MIERLTLKNYRNLHLEQGLTFDPLTIFVGPNGSGKTNLIRVLRFLQDAWTGTEDERRGINRFESAVARWGSGRILDGHLQTPAKVEMEISFRLQPGYTHKFVLELQVEDDNAVSLSKEALIRWQSKDGLLVDGSNTSYYHVDLNAGANYVSTYKKNSQKSAPEVVELAVGSLPARQLAVHSLQTWLLENAGSRSLAGVPFYESKQLVEQYLNEWAFYDASQMNIETIRRANPELGLSDRLLTSSGDNLALVMFNLSQNDIDFKDRMRDAMCQLFPATREIGANVVGRTSLTVQWYLRDIKRPFFLDEMSEGTVRMLCWATILFSPKIPRLIVIDEPEASLHPAWLQVLAGWIRDAARRTQIIVSTHSPDLLDYFTEDRASVRVFGKDPQNPLYSRVQSINAESIEDKLAEGWKLGDLYRVGDPQIGGWPW